MQLVLNSIDQRRAVFARHPYMVRLESISEDELRASVPAIGFWVLAFHDVLRLGEQNMRDPALRRWAGRHRREDSGHDAWFLADLARMGVGGDPGWLFGPAHAPVRDAVYAILSEVQRVEHDSTRVALSHAFEAASTELLVRAARRSPQVFGGKLEWFGHRHLDAELDHEMWDEDHDAVMLGLALDTERRDEALAATGRIFDALTRIMDHLETLPLQAATPLVTRQQLSA